MSRAYDWIRRKLRDLALLFPWRLRYALGRWLPDSWIWHRSMWTFWGMKKIPEDIQRWGGILDAMEWPGTFLPREPGFFLVTSICVRLTINGPGPCFKAAIAELRRLDLAGYMIFEVAGRQVTILPLVAAGDPAGFPTYYPVYSDQGFKVTIHFVENKELYPRGIRSSFCVNAQVNGYLVRPARGSWIPRWLRRPALPLEQEGEAR